MRAAQAEARLAEELAAAELDTREKFRSILIESLRMLDTETSNEAVTSLDDFLSILAGKIEEYLPDAPDLEASLRMRIGVGQTRESKFESAEYNLRRALAGWIEATDAESPETAAAKHNLARMYWKSGDYASAEPLYRAALVTRRSLGEDAALDAARTAQQSGDIGRAKENAEALRARKADLVAKLEEDIDELEDKFDALGEDLELLELAPRKSDVHVERFTLLWVPRGADLPPAE